MAFFSQQEYLAAQAREGQMRMRGITPPPPPGYVHPPEHERVRMQRMLDSIPETQPGPNAFAIMERQRLERQRTQEILRARRERGLDASADQAAAMVIQRGEGVLEVGRQREAPRQRAGSDAQKLVDAARQARKERREENAPAKQPSLKDTLATNPIYQRELQRRRATPPTDIHPAFRQRSVSEASVVQPPRDSTCTNITDFMKAGESPKLKLNATPNPSSVPTFRGRVEERTEQVEHERSGSQEERVPVFHPTPKMSTSKDFVQRPGTPANDLQKADSGSKLPVKTPKKSIFSKLKLSTNSRMTTSQSGSNLPEDPATLAEEKVPVKVQAVLGESPSRPSGRLSLGASPTKLPRSPSKRGKGFFSRKNADSAGSGRPSMTLSELQRPLNTPSTVISDGLQTAISDPTHHSWQERRASSKRHSKEMNEKKKEVQKNPMMARSQSMKLATFDGAIPPTPPAKNTPPHEKAAKEAKEVMEMKEALKMPPSDSRRLAEENEGIISPADTTRFGNYGYREGPTLVTKPSMYSMHASVVPDLMEASTMEEMHARVGALDLEGFSSPGEDRIRRSNIAAAVYSPSNYSPDWASKAARGFATPGATPMLQQEESRASVTPSAHTKDSSSNGTIGIFYPELASDPNVGKSTSPQAIKNISDSPSNRGRTHLSTDHGRTHSEDHRDGDDKSLFAISVNRSPHRHSMINSPSSYSHASAMPSPLQYLPATVYTPPPRKGTKKIMQAEADVEQSKTSETKTKKPARGSGLGIQSNAGDDNGDVFDTGPSLLDVDEGCGTPTLQPTVSSSAYGDLASNDRERQRAALRDLPIETLDTLIDMVQARNNRVDEMREILRSEVGAFNARMDQRLSAAESRQHASPPQTSETLGQSINGREHLARSQVDRIPTDVAHAFYCGAQETGTTAEQEPESEQHDSGTETSESETIRELRETNKMLMAMVGGFSAKLSALEARMSRGSE